MKATNNEMSQLSKGSPEFLAKVAEMKELAAKVKELEQLQNGDDEFKKAFMTVLTFPMSQFQMARARIIKLSPLGEHRGRFPQCSSPL